MLRDNTHHVNGSWSHPTKPAASPSPRSEHSQNPDAPLGTVSVQATSPLSSRGPSGLQPPVCRHDTQDAATVRRGERSRAERRRSIVTLLCHASSGTFDTPNWFFWKDKLHSIVPGSRVPGRPYLPTRVLTITMGLYAGTGYLCRRDLLCPKT